MSGTTSWLLLEHTAEAGLTAELRGVPYDASAVISDLRRRRHPNADFVASILTGQRQQLRTPAPR
jgi:hypothetical protein